jgi:hypothetical protein
MKIRMTIEVEIDDAFNPLDEEEKQWLEDEILTGNDTLILHSNEIGDYIGIVKSVKNIKWIKK